jgi:scyllo-inositol 2-dehydrogenase (NADP+)
MRADDGAVGGGGLRVGVAAFGMAAQVFHVPVLGTVPDLALQAVASRRPDAVRIALPDVRIHPEPVSLCQDPDLDIVVIPTPNHTHAPLAEAALRAGKHVVVDKPFALDTSEAGRLVSLARDTGRVLSVFHNRRWDGDFLTLRDVIRTGRVGRPVQLESHFDRFRPAVRDRWREQPGPGAGIWYDLGPHLIDQALQLFGLPRTVSADLAALRDSGTVDDYAHVVLGYDRLRVVLHATMLAAAEPPRFVLHGTAGSFVIHGLDPQEEALKAGKRPGESGWGLGAPDGILVKPEGEQSVPRQPGDYRRFYESLRDAIRERREPPVTPEEAVAVMRVMDAARRSSEIGRRMEVERNDGRWRRKSSRGVLFGGQRRSFTLR